MESMCQNYKDMYNGCSSQKRRENRAAASMAVTEPVSPGAPEPSMSGSATVADA